jgi:hypothetical protein
MNGGGSKTVCESRSLMPLHNLGVFQWFILTRIKLHFYCAYSLLSRPQGSVT